MDLSNGAEMGPEMTYEVDRKGFPSQGDKEEREGVLGKRKGKGKQGCK